MKSTIQSHKLSSSEAGYLKGRRDILTFEEFESGMSIVVCKDCKTPHLESTWLEHNLGPRCYNCNCTETIDFSLNFYNKNATLHIRRKKIRISKNFSHESNNKFSKIVDFFRNIDLLEKMLDLSQSFSIVRCIAIIVCALSVGLTFWADSKSKIPVDSMSNRFSMTVESILNVNDTVIEMSTKAGLSKTKQDYYFVKKSSQIFEHNNATLLSLKETNSKFDEKRDDVNYHLEEWFYSCVDWISKKLN